MQVSAAPSDFWRIVYFILVRIERQSTKLAYSLILILVIIILIIEKIITKTIIAIIIILYS